MKNGPLTEPLLGDTSPCMESVSKWLVSGLERTPNGGKWLVFCGCANVERLWSLVASADQLGTGAKVSTHADPTRFAGEHVICVYTHDCRDEADVLRVGQRLAALVRMPGRRRVLRYKANATTRAGLFGVGAGMYALAPPYRELERWAAP